MISIEQIRAARALLDLNQEELAKAAGISLRTLNTLERAVVAPRMETLRALQAVLEARGIEFLPDHGVKLRSERLDVIKIEGSHSVEKFLDDIIDQLKENGGEVLFNGIDERKFAGIDNAIMDRYYRRNVINSRSPSACWYARGSLFHRTSFELPLGDGKLFLARRSCGLSRQHFVLFLGAVAAARYHAQPVGRRYIPRPV